MPPYPECPKCKSDNIGRYDPLNPDLIKEEVADEPLVVMEFLADAYLTDITDKAYDIINITKNPILISLYHITNACMMIIEKHGLSDELSALLKPVLKTQKILSEAADNC